MEEQNVIIRHSTVSNHFFSSQGLRTNCTLPKDLCTENEPQGQQLNT